MATYKINFNCKTIAVVDEMAVALSVAEQLKAVAETLATSQPRRMYSVLVVECNGDESRKVFRWLKRG